MKQCQVCITSKILESKKLTQKIRGAGKIFLFLRLAATFFLFCHAFLKKL